MWNSYLLETTMVLIINKYRKPLKQNMYLNMPLFGLVGSMNFDCNVKIMTTHICAPGPQNLVLREHFWGNLEF